MSVNYRLGYTDIQIHDWGSCVVLHDGKMVYAEPHDTDEYRNKAKELGYGDNTLKMSQEHEVMHVLLAKFLGLFESPVMRGVAEGQPDSRQLGLEEDAVLALQALTRAIGIDILSLAENYAEKGKK